jgi:hypothetical protein
MRTTLRIAVAASSLLAVPGVAQACGGFFCSNANPVDQTAEQVVFAQEDGKAATYIQVSYQGSPEAFAWIVPVLQVPEKIEVSELGMFAELQALTAPRFLQPPFTGSPGGCGGGCGGSAPGIAPPMPLPAEKPAVQVLDETTVGPFETVTLAGESATELLEWLQARRFDVSGAATELVQAYLDEGAKFVAIKLTPSAGVQDIKPLKLTFPTFEPCVPLRLTRIAVAQQLPVIVWILGETRAVPTTFGHAEVDHGKLRFDFNDPFTGTNYRRLVDESANALGGRAFVTEYAGRTSELLPQARGFRTRELLKGSPYLTRLFTVISPDEMTADPFFRLSTPDERLADVSNVHQLGDEAFDTTGGGVGAVALSLLSAALLRRRRA